MGAAEMARIGALIGRTLRHRDDEAAVAARSAAEVRELCAGFPPYPDAGRDVTPPAADRSR